MSVNYKARLNVICIDFTQIFSHCCTCCLWLLANVTWSNATDTRKAQVTIYRKLRIGRVDHLDLFSYKLRYIVTCTRIWVIDLILRHFWFVVVVQIILKTDYFIFLAARIINVAPMPMIIISRISLFKPLATSCVWSVLWASEITVIGNEMGV